MFAFLDNRFTENLKYLISQTTKAYYLINDHGQDHKQEESFLKEIKPQVGSTKIADDSQLQKGRF